jgi:tetratricopeptide (TPR) repeat protein
MRAGIAHPPTFPKEIMFHLSGAMRRPGFMAVAITVGACLCVLTLTLHAQTLPALPQVSFENFGPEIREQARKAYAEAQAHPRDAEANGRLGMILHTYEAYDIAAICYERARSLAPEDFRWIYYIAIVKAALGAHGEAANVFKEAVQRKPDYMPAQLRLADSLSASGQLNQSRQYYEAVIKNRAGVAQAYYGLGRIYAAGGDLAGAVAQYRKAIELFQDYGAAHYALGLALRDQGQVAEAQEHLARSQKLKFSRPPLDDPLLIAVAELNTAGAATLKRGVILESAGQIEASIAEHERALAINPQLAQANINLISLYGRTGQFEKAAQAYRAALTANPNLADAHYNFGVLLVGQSNYKEAAQAFQRCLQINPFHAEAHYNYAVLIEGEGELVDAAAHFRAAIENSPGHRFAHFHLGRILVHQNKLPEAIEQFHQALAPEDDETPRFTYALGATYIRAGNKEKGIQYLREALKRAAALGQTQLAGSIERDLRSLENAEKGS